MPTEDLHNPDAAAATEDRSAHSAGEMLRVAREAKGLSEKAVADRLHITVHYVKALENDQFEKLPGVVFARGYLKSYADLVGVEREELLARFEQITATVSPVQARPMPVSGVQRMQDRNKPWVFASIAIFVAGSIALWLYSSVWGENSQPQAAAPEPTPVRESQSATLRPAPLTVTSQSQAEPIIQEAMPDTTSDAMRTSAEDSEVVDVVALNTAVIETEETSITTAAVAAEPEESSTSEEASLETLSAEVPAVVDEGDGPAINVSQLPNGDRMIAVDAEGSDVLRIRFSGESWVEVNDGTEQNIYRDLRAAGDVLVITGQGPFNVLLGDAPLTELIFNGSEVDVSDDIRIDNSARLTVGL